MPNRSWRQPASSPDGETVPPSERGLRRIVVAMMTSPINLTALGVSLLVAVVLGIQLGASTIEEIKPFYFQGAAVHPRDRGAAVDESSLNRAPPSTYAGLYGWDEGDAARVAGCGGDCGALRSDRTYAYSAVVPYFGPGGRRVREQAVVEDEVVVPRDEAIGGPVEPMAQKPDVSRYTDYPLTYEAAAFVPAQAAESAPVEEAAVAEPPQE